MRASRLIISISAVAVLTFSFATMPRRAGAATSITVAPPLNVSQEAGSQVEATVAIDPTNPARIFALGRDETGNLISARSSDGGTTWIHAKVGTGTGSSGLPAGWGNTSVAWDDYGNLFVTYLGTIPTTHVIFAVSTDGGATFTAATDLAPTADQPVVAAGGGAVWVTYNISNVNYVKGAAVTGLGQVGAFGNAETVTGANGYGFGDIAVSSTGAVMVAFGPATAPPGQVLVSRDPDGLGPAGFDAVPISAAPTQVGGFTFVPAAPQWGIDSEAHLAWDHSRGAHNGRVYLSYLDSSTLDPADTNLYVAHSDDGGTTWSLPVKVNDDTGNATQMMPSLALDQATGALAATWFDTRDDASRLSVRYYSSVSVDGGLTWSANQALSPGSSNQSGATPPPPTRDTDFGDYTGSTFLGGRLVTAWPDNSNSTGDNPAGAGASFDLYVEVEQVTAPDTVPPLLAPAFSAPQPFLRFATGITASPNATDASGIAAQSCDAVDTSSVGRKTLTCTATDNAGNTASVNVPYVVGFGFASVSPADGATFKHTSAISVSFQLVDANGVVSDTEAAALVPSTTVAFDSLAGVQPSYKKQPNVFSANLKIAKPAPGGYAVTIDVVSAGVTLAHRSIPIAIV